MPNVINFRNLLFLPYSIVLPSTTSLYLSFFSTTATGANFEAHSVRSTEEGFNLKGENTEELHQTVMSQSSSSSNFSNDSSHSLPSLSVRSRLLSEFHLQTRSPNPSISEIWNSLEQIQKFHQKQLVEFKKSQAKFERMSRFQSLSTSSDLPPFLLPKPQFPLSPRELFLTLRLIYNSRPRNQIGLSRILILLKLLKISKIEFLSSASISSKSNERRKPIFPISTSSTLTVEDFNNLISYAYKSSRTISKKGENFQMVKDEIEELSKYLESGVEMDRVTYNLHLTITLNARMWKSHAALLDSMRSQGVQGDSYTWSLRLLSVILRMLPAPYSRSGSSQKIDLAIPVIADIVRTFRDALLWESWRVKHRRKDLEGVGIQLWNLTVWGLGKVRAFGAMEDLASVFWGKKSLGTFFNDGNISQWDDFNIPKPNLVSYLIFVQSYCQRGDLESLMEVLVQMAKDSNLPKNTKSIPPDTKRPLWILSSLQSFLPLQGFIFIFQGFALHGRDHRISQRIKDLEGMKEMDAVKALAPSVNSNKDLGLNQTEDEKNLWTKGRLWKVFNSLLALRPIENPYGQNPPRELTFKFTQPERNGLPANYSFPSKPLDIWDEMRLLRNEQDLGKEDDENDYGEDLRAETVRFTRAPSPRETFWILASFARLHRKPEICFKVFALVEKKFAPALSAVQAFERLQSKLKNDRKKKRLHDKKLRLVMERNNSEGWKGWKLDKRLIRMVKEWETQMNTPVETMKVVRDEGKDIRILDLLGDRKLKRRKY